MAFPLIPLLGAVGTLLERIIPDPQARAEAQLKLFELQQRNDLAELTSAATIITAEAKSDSWLAANWRPVTMLTFVALIVAKWLGFTAPGVTEPLELKLMDIIELGLGGYVIGRSVEKVVKAAAEHGALPWSKPAVVSVAPMGNPQSGGR